MWTVIFVFISFFIYISYIYIVNCLFGTPKSLSESYYLFKEKREWMKNFFPLVILLMVSLLMPAWIEISKESNFQFLAFLSAGSLLFTGTVPAFKSNKSEDKIHTISAICSAVFSLMWVIIVAKTWILLLIITIAVLIDAINEKALIKSKIYWLESIVFLSTFASIMYCLSIK